MKSIIACTFESNEDLQLNLDKIGLKNIIKKDDNVLIKPNFTWPNYKEGVTTNPVLIDKLTSVLKNYCRNIYIGESDGANRYWTADQCFKGHGLYEMSRKNGFDLINLTKYPTVSKSTMVEDQNIRLNVSKFILNKVDVLITLPVLKIHAATGVSLGLKNQWGCLPDPMRLLYHPILHKGIVAVNKIHKPSISIIDATYGLNRSGPIIGDPIKLNKIFISNDVTSLDILVCSFMGIPFERIDHIRIAKNEFLKDFDIKQIIKHGNFNGDFQFKLKKSFSDKVLTIIMFNKELNDLFYNSFLSNTFQKLLLFYKTLFQKEIIY